MTDLLSSVNEEAFHKDLGSIFVNDTGCSVSSVRSIVEHIIMGLHFSGSIMHEVPFRPDEAIASLRSMPKREVLDRWNDVVESFVAGFNKSFGKSVDFRGVIEINDDFVFGFTNHVVYHIGQLNTALKLVGGKTYSGEYNDYCKQGPA